MIEFTLSRVSLIVCGAILLTIIIVPVSDNYEEKENEQMIGVADNISYTIDSFWDSETDIMILRGWDVLPSLTFSLNMEGNKLTISDGNRDYVSLLSNPADSISLSYNDKIYLERNENILTQINIF